MTVPFDQSEPHDSLPVAEATPPGMGAAARWAFAGALMVMVVLLAFGLGFGTHMLVARETSATTVVAKPASGAPDFRVLDEMWKALKDNYVDPGALDAELLRTGAINGLIGAVGDTHQIYVSRQSAELDDLDLQGKFEGIGATVDQKGGEITIVRPFDDSPAKKAGIRAGDVLLAINGESTKGLSDKDAVRKIRGPAGSSVKLQVRHSDGKVEELTIQRDEIKVASVKGDKPQDAQGNVVNDIAYVRIDQFTARTSTELRDYLKTIDGQGYKGLIIDLRNNPGGLLRSVMEVSQEFMKDQTILIEQHRGGSEQKFTTKGDGMETDGRLKIAVLVNHNSASASEILAGAIRDNGRGTVLGETTFGKGTVNQFIDLPSDGGKLYVTVGRWLTPKRDQIEGRGIKPDIEVKVGDNENPLEYYNSVMFRAVDLLRGG